MYSRSRMFPAEERYQSNIPPVYNGNRFPSVRRESDAISRQTAEDVPEEHGTPEPSPCDEADGTVSDPNTTDSPPPELPENAVANAAENHETRSVFGLEREELVLLAILLLLCAEHERSMDVIVILLLLLSVH